ncbi:MAG TPA: nuclear transport factor 2 family protein [Casimicrobiaceae bacterium]|nr:nuclear transport factor 2 family protein [Casimicrobiaceae bacterium]
MDSALLEELRIRQVIENWMIWRDSGDWERFRTVWHPGAVMMATWFQGPAERFIEVTREGWDKGVSILHFLGGSSIDVGGERAIAQTRMTISQRAAIDGVTCDVLCTGRFYDFFEQRDGAWGLVLRQPIYEKDRLDVLDPGAELRLDTAALSQFPEGYRHLAYLQSKLGYNVKRDMPTLRGPEVQRLYARGAAWLSGRAAQP